jgi:DNA-binding CsgD family transcriptional regulator/tetratricopeptide (TPR) repeat protein
MCARSVPYSWSRAGQVRDAAVMGTRGSGVFVGRERELASVVQRLDHAVASRGATVLVTGDAGIGKTRLAGEIASRAGAKGFEVLVGRSIDVVGVELPFQPFVDALRPLGNPFRERVQGSQLQVFESALAMLSERASITPVLVVLEDLHWADASTLDLVVFLAHNIGDVRAVLVATCRSAEPWPERRVARLTDGVRRSGDTALVVELAPLTDPDLRAVLDAHTDGSTPPAALDAIVVRAGGNPFFAEELLAAAAEPGDALPRGVRDLLSRRLAPLDRSTRDVLRLLATAGGEVRYPLLRSLAGVSDGDLHESLRGAVDHGVLVADGHRFRFRHPLLAEAVYATVLPGERERLHGRVAEELERAGTVEPAELAVHWAAASRHAEALVASVEAARHAEAVFALVEARAHVERALELWDLVPNAADLVSVDRGGLCAWGAEIASSTGAGPRAVTLAERAIDEVAGDPDRVARLYGRLSRYLHESGRTDAALAACQRMVALVPSHPPSAARAEALAVLAQGLSLCWQFERSRATCEQALAMAHAVGASSIEIWALDVFGRDLAYLGRSEEGLRALGQARDLASAMPSPADLLVAYVSLTDVLMMLGRLGESVEVGRRGLEVVRRYGSDATVLIANIIEALVASGEWDDADRLSAAAVRSITANYPYMVLMTRADLELGRGDFASAKAHLDAALPSLREDRGLGIYDVYLAELALWERRWVDADAHVDAALTQARSPHSDQLRVWFSAKGLRALAELTALARARHDADAAIAWLARADRLITTARSAAATASSITPNAGGWLALAKAEHDRAHSLGAPDTWSGAANTWEHLERPVLAAYCRWRESEALVAADAPRTAAAVPLRYAHMVATRVGAEPLKREVELLAQRARLDLARLEPTPPDETSRWADTLGLTPREVDVLGLVARGYTNPEIGKALFISVKTASVHVSNVLRKLDVSNRREAAAVAHRLTTSTPHAPVRPTTSP